MKPADFEPRKKQKEHESARISVFIRAIFVYIRGKLTWSILPALIVCVSSCSPQIRSFVNFSHLRHLTERIEFMGDSVSIVHVYANYPTYEWVDAKESGPEGIACVDDAGRAAVAYLRHYELKHDPRSLADAKSLLSFIMKMQAGDGQFYNFVFKDHSTNKEGKTSFKSFGWWAARGVWAMATGCRALKDVDPPLAGKLKAGVEKTFPYIDTLLMNYGKTKRSNGYKMPRWLLYESATDASSELVLGLIEYYSTTRDTRAASYIKKFAEGFMLMQDGDIESYPYGLHRSWETTWHAWGNGQTQGLATAGNLLNDTAMIHSAEREALGFYSRLLIDGFMKEVDIASPDKKTEYEQIAYGVRPMTMGLLRLHEATKNELYLKMAGLAASWFFGNNAAHQIMYDSASGRCFDGIRDSSTINKNSGAESTIEALMTLTELEQYPSAQKYLSFRKTGTGNTPRYKYATFTNPSGDELTLAIDLQEHNVRIIEGDESRRFREDAKR